MKPKLQLFTLAAVMILIAGLSVGCNKATPARTDAQVASDVQSKIMSDPAVQSRDISVNAANGVVTLSGTVSSDAERNASSNDAGAINGVKTVINNLTIQQAQTTPAPAEQAQAAPPPAPAPEPRRETRRDERRAAQSRRDERAARNREATDMAASQTPPPPAQSEQMPVARMQPAPPPPPPAPKPKKVTIPDGTTLSVRLIDSLDSDSAHTGDSFRATLDSPIVVNGEEIVPSNSDVQGRVVDVKSAGRFAGQSLLTIELTKITIHGRSYPLHTNQWSREASSRGKSTAKKVGAGAVIGGIIGAIAGGGKGAAIGATVGAGAGGGVQAATHGEQIKLGSEALLNFQTQTPLTVILQPNQRSNGNHRQPME